MKSASWGGSGIRSETEEAKRTTSCVKNIFLVPPQRLWASWANISASVLNSCRNLLKHAPFLHPRRCLHVCVHGLHKQGVCVHVFQVCEWDLKLTEMSSAASTEWRCTICCVSFCDSTSSFDDSFRSIQLIFIDIVLNHNKFYLTAPQRNGPITIQFSLIQPWSNYLNSNFIQLKQFLSSGNQQIASKLLSDPIPRPERARGDCGEKNLPFNRKKPPSEPEPGRAAICLDQLGAERTGKRGQQAP